MGHDSRPRAGVCKEGCPWIESVRNFYAVKVMFQEVFSMRKRIVLAGILSLLALAFILQCSRDDITMTEAPFENNPGSESPAHGPLGQVIPDTCGSVGCIDSFIADWNGAGHLVVEDGEYQLSGHKSFHLSSPKTINLTIEAEDPNNPPTLQLTSCFVWDTTEKHATMFCAGGSLAKDITHFKNIIIEHNCYMDRSGGLPGIQFEATPVLMEHVTLTNSSSATTHFMTVQDVTLDDIVLAANHELAFGPEDWCGGNCGGFGNPMPGDGSEIKNSELYGSVFFDVQGMSRTFYFTDNNPLTKVDVNADDDLYVQGIVLEGNTFADQAGAAIIIRDNFTVEAEGNVTTRGPCECDALEDFDTSGSNLGDNALDLVSWVYGGVEYTEDVDLAIVGDIDVSYNYITCVATVTWTTNAHATSRVYHGADCNSLTSSGGSSALVTSHSVEVSVSDYYRSWSFKVYSENSCDSVLSDCITKRRPTCATQ